MAPIPITILTGFLGSGKTTLLLNIIPQLRTTNPSYRLALLKNEFGDVAIDSQLASSSAVSGVQELLNGCICCNLVGQLSTALAELRSSVNPDRIVIETSGSAFPATLAIEVNRLARDTGHYTLDGVVSVIDVENWKGYEDTSYTARIQARYTDLIVFSKWENCDERRFDDCLDRVGDLEVDVAWVKSDKGRIPVDVIFGIDGGLARALSEQPNINNNSDAHAHDHDHDHNHDHQSEVEVLSIALSGEPGAVTDATKLMSLLNAAPKDEVYRIKSVLTTSPTVRSSGEDEAPAPTTPSSRPGRYILNWAFGRWTFTPLDPETAEHSSSRRTALRMTMILARYESGKWKKKLETGGFLKLEGGAQGELVVTKIS
ncbi:cobW-domain-containing protein [Annulohypoxylon truncatum]|uniref:cobW-domain-containing protein n=1 Tax=Annulohypoxylon truncatum TaxID=327061 RepID=UPI00200821DD|nr:cobW-domain-containing protein [Annulohypoxylon truncatum]KAI1214508.1 cobW-domain-containing protein [Annulohypoxylon truncatum]